MVRVRLLRDLTQSSLFETLSFLPSQISIFLKKGSYPSDDNRCIFVELVLCVLRFKFFKCVISFNSHQSSMMKV